MFLKDPDSCKGELVRCFQIREVRPEGASALVLESADIQGL